MGYVKHPRGKEKRKTIKIHGPIKGDNPKIKDTSSQPKIITKQDKIIAGWVWIAFITISIYLLYNWHYG